MAERAGIFDDTPDFDVSKFTTKAPSKSTEPPPPSAEAVRAVSERANFQSRQPVPAAARQAAEAAPARGRRRRTGRNLQLNVKLDAATLESFYEIADSRGWVLGETLTRAIAALKKELSAEK
jgi:hypothetical protein